MKIRSLILLLVAVTMHAQAVTRVWTNTLGGDWFAFQNWSPGGVPGAQDTVFITNSGTYTVTAQSGAVTIASLTVGGNSGAQTLIQGSSSVLTVTNQTDIKANGVLAITNGGFTGAMLVEAGGQLQLNSSSGLFFYNSAITNLGTVAWMSGSLAVGGNNAQTTYITNAGLWQMTGDNPMNYGGGNAPTFLNSGTVRKTGTSGSSTFNAVNFNNLPGGLVDVQSGTIGFSSALTNSLGGTFSAAASSFIKFYGAGFTDAGGVTSGAGAFQFIGGSFFLRTNIIPGLLLTGGDVYIDTNHFQQGGAITNLTLDGATLHGTNRVAGTFTINTGDLVDQMTVLPGGQLVFATSGSKLLYSFTLFNQGTVNWLGGDPAVGGTVISNGGFWLASTDDSLSYGGGAFPVFTNSGTIRKTAGAGNTSFANVNFTNLPSGVIEADSGTIVLPPAYTNSAGELRLNGGAFQAAGGFTLAGGTLDGTGSVSQCFLAGGTISPGLSGPGKIYFTQGLNLGSNATVTLDGTGTTPGTLYDQLAVTGAVSLTNCTLQLTSLPAVTNGATFVLVTNTGGGVTGTFNGLPENAYVYAGAQAFRIHYSAGGGSAVTLVRTNAPAPHLTATSGAYSGGAFQFSGIGQPTIQLTVQATTNFLQWTNIGTATIDGTGKFTFKDPNAGSYPYRFYRTTN